MLRPNLWQLSDFPDNHVDSHFEQRVVALRQTLTWTDDHRELQRRRWALALALAGLHVASFLLLYLTTPAVLSCSVFVALVGGDMLLALSHGGAKSIGQQLLVALFLVVLSPIVSHLTASVSSDTLYTCVAIGFLAHVVCHSYSPYPSLQAGIVGTNFALASTVALASRLSSSTDSLLFLLASNAITSIHQRFVTQQARHHPPK
eukprot:m.86972 g.86972  ORF g.86972 m.86972 type:complete len:204 (-) comp12824_c0_seq3:663-1274(-)